MSQDKTEFTITVNRTTKRGVVSGDSLHIRDVSAEVTLVNVTQDDIDAGLVFEIFRLGTPLAVCSSWTADGNGNAVGVFTTNTDPLATLFATADIHASKTVSYKAYTTNPLIPVVIDRMQICNFTAEDDSEPSELTNPADVLDALNDDIEALQAALAALTSEYQAALASLTGTVNGIDAAYQAGDNAVSGLIGTSVAAHNVSGAAHNDIRLLLLQAGTAQYVQCNNGALADGKWRKVITAEPNEFGEYMQMIQQAPTYVLNTETMTWEEET